MSWESKKQLIKTKTIKDSIDYNVAEHLGAPGTPNFKYSKYVIEVVSSDSKEFLYRVLMEPDGTWKHAKMFCDAWETPGVFNFEIFDEYFPNIKSNDIKTNTALFRIKPQIIVSEGKMAPAKKYFGRKSQVLDAWFAEGQSVKKSDSEG